MRKILLIAAVAFSLACLMPAPAAFAAPGDGPWVPAHRIGLGVNYWQTLEDIDVNNVDEHGFSYLVSYQFVPLWFLKLEADLEFFPELGKFDKKVLAPEAFVLVGGLLYGGAGIGFYDHDGDWGGPFYMLRVGLDIPVLPRLFVDINANYRFNDWDSLSGNDIKTDTVRLGAAVRFTL